MFKEISTKKKKQIFVFSTAFILILILFLLYSIGAFNNLQLSLSDNLYGSKSHINNIVIISIDDESLQEIGTWPWDRANYSSLIQKLKGSKIIVFDISFLKNSNGDEKFQEAILNSNSTVILGFEFLKLEDTENGLKGIKPLYPISILSNYTKIGYVNVLTDQDGVIRRIPLKLSEEHQSLIGECYKEIMGIEPKEDVLNVNYIGPSKSFTYYSFYDVLEKDYDFKDKIVFIGSSAPNLNDNHLVPTSKHIAMPGVEIHANGLNTLLTKSFIQNQSNFSIYLLIIMFTILISFIAYKLDPKWSIIISIGLIIIYEFIAILTFNNGLVLNLVYIPLTIILTLITQIIIIYVLEKKHKQYLVDVFQRYVSSDVVKQIIENPSKIKFGGEKKHLTILFCDIRSFTTISEKLGATKLVQLLNEYLTEMTQVILDNKGLVDKFIGDAIMALWGAPLNNIKSEEDACLAAVEMINRLEEFNSGKDQKLHIGIGINSGEVIVGNLGSNKRFDYTAIGDAVNTASRYEGLTKYYGCEIIVGETTYQKVKYKFNFRELDMVAVKGKKKYTKIYQLMVKDNKKLKEDFDKGLKLYKNHNFDDAKKLFEILVKDYSDKPSKLFIERCEEFKKNPPCKDWKGEYVMNKK